MNNQSLETPVCRSYTVKELALLYSPDVSPGTAYRRLHRWILYSKPLSEELCRLGVRRRQRIYTPLQVRAIFDHLGEP